MLKSEILFVRHLHHYVKAAVSDIHQCDPSVLPLRYPDIPLRDLILEKKFFEIIRFLLYYQFDLSKFLSTVRAVDIGRLD